MRIALYVALTLLISTRLLAQAPVAAFTASSTSGCAPLAITFTDQSTGGVQFWNWDFGNGTLSNLQNPTVVYQTPGVYTVKLVVRNANGPAGITKTNYITVNPSPTALYTVNSQLGCAPSTFQFTDASTDAAGSIIKWKWTFSDGSTSTSQNPSIQLTTPGFYDVALLVTSSTGCTGSVGGNRYIRVVPGVKADFIYAMPAICRPPFTVSFSDQSSGPGNLSYSWDLGNSNSSTQKNPSTVYNAAGSYTVKLTTVSDYGCQGSTQKTIALSANNASFSSPDSVCPASPVNFQNTSAPPATSTLWKFGDGSQSTQTSPSKTYASPGTYPVMLIGTYPNCADTATKNIVVRSPPTVNFTSPKNKSCKPFTVSFQDLSPDARTWQWNFGDGGTASTQNPSHAYAATGQYDVTLTITDSKGCQNTITKTNFVEIIEPVAIIQNVPTGGCAPFTYTFTSASLQIDGIVDYKWDFGDGTPTVSGPGSTATHTYLTTNNYTVTLTVTTTDGCTNTTVVPNAVRVGTHTVPDFSKDISTVCHSSTVTFENLSAPKGDEARWLFGDGFGSINVDTAKHKYADTGTYTVTLININNGCPDTAKKTAFITVLPPVADFSYTVNCSQKNQAIFKDSSVLNPALPPPVSKWDFGDAGATGTGTPATYIYPAVFPATYSVQYIVDDGTCADTIVKPVLIIDNHAQFTISKSPACRNENILFTGLDIPQHVFAYQWVITTPGGNTSTMNTQSFTTSFPTVGNYQVTLTVVDIHGCSSTTTQFVNITGPVSGFTIANNGGCKGGPVQFTDNSVSATGTITGWNWDFGDATPFATTQNPTHSYTDTGVYTVALRVTDNLGCSDTYAAPVSITKPIAAFGTDTTLFCPGGPMTFKDSSIGSVINAWTWYFGDGSTASTQNPVHAYGGGDAVYSIKLVVTDAHGCSDSVTRTNYVTIKKAKPAFGVQDSTTICPPLETKFTFQGKDYESFYWDFGDGGSSSLPNPSHFYNSFGSFTATLYLVGFGGCVESASSVVNIYNPTAYTTVNYPPPYTTCNEITVDFDFTIPPSTKSYFYFGDGAIDSSQQKTLQHYYGSPAFYAPFVQITDKQGCIANVGGPNTIRVLGAIPIFGLDKKKFCDAGTVAFTNFTISNDPIVSETWQFGDGNSSTGTTPANATHTYPQPGLYVVTLTESTQAGCVKSGTDTVRVLRTPDPSISSLPSVCINNSISFEGVLAVPDTAITWKWDFGNGLTSAGQQPAVTYTQAGNFMVHASAANSLGCSDTTSTTVTVNNLPTVTITGDTSVLVGMGITMPVSFSSNAVWYNWTPADHLSCTDCPNPYANPKFTTTYQVTVTDSNNCTSSRYITLITLCNNKNFFIPNTFSPNRDGNNDIFYPRGTGIDRIQAMRIFNRWGEPVYEKRFFPANDPASGWDGTYKGKPASTDTYIYMIDIICENATIITYKGNVTLIR